MNDQDIQAELAELRAIFLGELPKRLGRVSAALEQLFAGKRVDPGARQEAIHSAHALVGVAGMFGFNDISTSAATLEQTLRELPDNAEVAELCRVAITRAEAALMSTSDQVCSPAEEEFPAEDSSTFQREKLSDRPLDPEHEARRLASLRACEILDTPPEPAFDALTTIAARVFDMPISLVSMVDADRIWVKSQFGLEVTEMPRETSFCGHMVAGNGPLIVPNALEDERFRAIPWVEGGPRIRFYAGFPVRDSEGLVLGTLCVMDRKPRTFSAEDLDMLAMLTQQAMAQLELRRRLNARARLQAQMADNIRVREQAERKVRNHAKMLTAIASVQDAFILDEDPWTLFDGVLAQILELTQSEFGFLGEVLYKNDGSPYLKTFAITNIAWNAETEAFFRDTAPQGMLFERLDTLFGAVLTTKAPVYSASPSTDPRRGGIPEGHPELKSFMGIPYFKGEQLVGMAGVANRPGGYNQDLLEALAPFSSTCANLIEAHRSEVRRQHSEDALRDSETRIRAIVETAVDGIVTIDASGIIEHVNTAVEQLLGFDEQELVGQNVGVLVPTPHKEHHRRYISNYLETGRADIIGTRREELARHKDGSMIPVELSISEMNIAGKPMFTGILRDIRERRKVERMKSEFVSTVSHELRTPLTSIRGSLGLLAGGLLGELPPEANEMVDIALANSERLIRITNDILDLEKMESGRLELHPELVSLVDAIKRAIESDQSFALQHKTQFVLEPVPIDALVFVDEDRLVQILTNLMSNAAKFSPPGETVQISVEHRGDGYRVCVRDHGPGIPEDFQERVFSRFAQADASNARPKGGTGLGLSITKVLVERMGGTIDFENLSDGTCFFFELPAAER